MSVSGDLLTNPLLWGILGVCLIVIEVALLRAITLPVGMSALGMAVLTYLDHRNWFAIFAPIFTSWERVFIVFAILLVLSIAVLQVQSRKDG